MIHQIVTKFAIFNAFHIFEIFERISPYLLEDVFCSKSVLAIAALLAEIYDWTQSLC